MGGLTDHPPPKLKSVSDKKLVSVKISKSIKIGIGINMLFILEEKISIGMLFILEEKISISILFTLQNQYKYHLG